MENSTVRKRKSEALTPEEHKKFKEYAESFMTKRDCMEALKISLPTMDRITFKGTGRPDTIERIREAIKAL